MFPTSLLVAHANTLRGLVKIIDDIGDDEISEVAIPTGIPIVYKFDEKMNPVAPPPSADRLQQAHMTGLFLEKPGLLKDALKREADWCAQVPGYNSTMQRTKTPMSPKERSLNKLNSERQLGKWAGQFIDGDEDEDDGSDGNMGKPISWQFEDNIWEDALKDLGEGIAFDPDYPKFHPNATSSSSLTELPVKDDDTVDWVAPTIIKSSDSQACMTAFPPGSEVPVSKSRSASVIVIIRHGKTEHNKLGLFTGWEDVPLANEGVEEAKEAGRLLKLHGFEFDVVYVSWLSRAIDTALYVLDELDCLWLPIIKSWRLNER
jgi:2,3-bisphosphoglycerate-dependent phosphoglycerate mutase